MKYTVNVTVTLSIEVDSDELKKEFGKVNNHLILEEAKGSAFIRGSIFDCKTEIVDKYDDKKVVKVRKGISSH